MCFRPGRTNLTEHSIDTGSSRQPPYRLPLVYRETVRQELKEMEQNRIIEPSTSEWSASIVLAKKRTELYDFVSTTAKLNSVSRADAYPMPRIDKLIDRLGKAKYITRRKTEHSLE